MFESVRSNPFVKSTFNEKFLYADAVLHLLESLNDKDDQVKAVAEASLIKIADKKPDEVISYVCDYKKKNPKSTDALIAVVLR